ncbi:hypothetical protein O6H91_22G007000 [Diphasiastrum complanatum]|nr:hypothetical protein O6H91_22G007000 [Diphasiastrum complanatum]
MRMTQERAAGTSIISAPPKILAYELVQGSLVRWSTFQDKQVLETPTAVFIHGILGGRRNWASFCKRLAQEFPTWQFLLVDLRCHGDSAAISKSGPNTVVSAARDVLQLLARLKLTPRVLVGHSFGGKVVLSMVGQAAKPLARPVQVWVLDSTPGQVRSGGDGEDHPAKIISFLRTMPAEVPSRRFVIDALLKERFSLSVAQWMTTNLRPIQNPHGGSSLGHAWLFDLNGIADLYRSYEVTNLWSLVDNVPQGIHIKFLRAERSLHRWAHEDVERIRSAEQAASSEAAGVQLHVLEAAGHWVHADNPEGLIKILTSSFSEPRLN